MDDSDEVEIPGFDPTADGKIPPWRDEALS
jgi:hypothetical protein